MIAYLVSHEETETTVALRRALQPMVARIEARQSLEQLELRPASPEPALVLLMANGAGPAGVDAVIAFTKGQGRHAYVAYVAEDIPAADLRRLLGTGAAEWLPTTTAVADLPALIANASSLARKEAPVRSTFVSFAPAGGGVGNTTLAVEAAVSFARRVQGTEPRCCIVDLNFQKGNVCDLVDVRPKLDLKEFASDPGRLDDRLLEAFRSRTAFGVDVYATPKYSEPLSEGATRDAVFALCNILAQKYDRVHADLPSFLQPWAEEILRNSDAVLITSLFSVPSALRVAALSAHLGKLRSARSSVVVNRHVSGLFKKGLSQSEFERATTGPRFLYVAEDRGFASECANIGRPMMAVNPRKAICRDIRKVEAFIAPAEERPGGLRAALARLKR